MNIQTALKSDRVCKALTGLRVAEFQGLVPLFERNLRETRIKLKPERERKLGGGRRGKIPKIEEKLFVALLYLKCYPTFDVMGFFIGLDRTRSWRWIQLLFPTLEQTLGRELVLPERQINSPAEFIHLFPEVRDVFIDGTDRRIQKPKNIKKRNKLYSGKRKATTRKNIIIADEKKRVLILSPTKSGRRHDKRLIDKAGSQHLPPNITAWVDTGFQGLQKIHLNTMIPKKRTKKNPLTEEDKQENRTISGIRVVGEHAIAGIKRLRSTSDIYRNHRPNFDDTLMLLSTGIWNYHLKFATIHPTS